MLRTARTVLTVLSACTAGAILASDSPVAILMADSATFREMLAAKEIRRYVYLRTGQLLDVRAGDGAAMPAGDSIMVGSKDRPMIRKLTAGLPVANELTALGTECFLLKTIVRDKDRTLLIASDDTGALYGAYRVGRAVRRRRPTEE